jgi:hypothetical protein
LRGVTKIVCAFTGTATGEVGGFVLGTSDVGGMSVSYVVEEMDLRAGKEECCCDAMDRSISPTLIEEPTRFIEVVEIVVVYF